MFNVINTLIAVVSVTLMMRIYEFRFSLFSLSAVILSAFLMLPALQGTFMWLSGACNYLWGVPLVLALVYTKNSLCKVPESRLRIALFGLLCILSSAMHEALGVALVGTWLLMIFIRLIKKERVNKILLFGLLCCIIGASIPLTAEGIWRRADSRDMFSIYELARNFTLLCYNAIIPTLVFLYIFYKKRIAVLNDFEGCFVLPNLVVSFVFGVSGGWGGGYFYYAFSVLLLLLSVARNGSVSDRWKLRVGYSAAVGVLLVLGMWLVRQITWNDTWQGIIQRAKCNEIVVLSPSELKTIHFGDLASSFPLYEKTYMSPYMSAMLGIKELIVIPNFIVEDRGIYASVMRQSKEHIATSEVGGMQIVRLPKGYSYVEDNSSFIEGENGEKYYILLAIGQKTSILRLLNDRFIRRQRHKKCCVDYHDGCFYFIITSTGNIKKCLFHMKHLETGVKEEVVVNFNE